jgi:transposase
LYGDKAYDNQPCRDILSRHGISNCVTRKRVPSCKIQNKTRIVVEHVFSWLDKYRRIILRYDGLVCHFRSFHFLAALNLVSLRSQNGA